jgi:hypothetical protein
VTRAHQWLGVDARIIDCPVGHTAAEIRAWSDGVCDVCGRDDVKQGQWITECNHCNGDRGFECSWFEMNWWRCEQCTRAAGGLKNVPETKGDEGME